MNGQYWEASEQGALSGTDRKGRAVYHDNRYYMNAGGEFQVMQDAIMQH